jgi:hypothetical protein
MSRTVANEALIAFCKKLHSRLVAFQVDWETAKYACDDIYDKVLYGRVPLVSLDIKVPDCAELRRIGKLFHSKNIDAYISWKVSEMLRAREDFSGLYLIDDCSSLPSSPTPLDDENEIEYCQYTTQDYSCLSEDDVYL